MRTNKSTTASQLEKGTQKQLMVMERIDFYPQNTSRSGTTQKLATSCTCKALLMFQVPVAAKARLKLAHVEGPWFGLSGVPPTPGSARTLQGGALTFAQPQPLLTTWALAVGLQTFFLVGFDAAIWGPAPTACARKAK